MTSVQVADIRQLADVWTVVCASSRLRPNRGVCALLDGRQIAVFRTGDGALFAVDNSDPCSGANVISRGLVGTCGDDWVVASPMYKERFLLATGACIDDPTKKLATHRVTEFNEQILVMVGHSSDVSTSVDEPLL